MESFTTERNPTGYSNHDKGKENEKISEINWDADAIGNVKTIPDGIRWVYLRLIAIQLWDISLIKPISGYHHRCRFPNWIRKNIIGILPSITQGYRLLQRWKACEQKLFQWSGSNRLGFKEFKAKVAILAQSFYLQSLMPICSWQNNRPICQRSIWQDLQTIF